MPLYSQPDEVEAHAPPRLTMTVFLPEAPLAPWQHTAAMLALFGLWCVIGSYRAESVAQSTSTLRYLSSIMMGWMTLGCVVAGLYHRRRFFLDTLQRHTQSWPLEAAWGALVYLGAIVVLGSAHSVLRHVTQAPQIDRRIVYAMSPKTTTELAMWFLISLTAGFCEEHVFRGYLLPQSIALARRAGLSRTLAAVLSVIATSALFGALHLYQGVGGAIMITVLGGFFACVALHRGNLRAVIVAHFLQDFIGGLTLYLRHAHRP